MHWNICAARKNDKLLFLKEKVKLGEEKDNLLNYINILKLSCLDDIYKLEHPQHIPVPPNHGYEIRNGLFGKGRDIFLKTTRDGNEFLYGSI
jgi:hypothetical protein